jgi:hypothetical protein
MTQAHIIKRIEQLEREMQLVKQRVGVSRKGKPRKSAEDFFGMFHNDPDFKKAMQLRAAYRRSLRPGRGR